MSTTDDPSIAPRAKLYGALEVVPRRPNDQRSKAASRRRRRSRWQGENRSRFLERFHKEQIILVEVWEGRAGHDATWASRVVLHLHLGCGLNPLTISLVRRNVIQSD